MKRYCQTLDLKEDEQLIKEYCYWHSPEHIWPEIPEGIRAVGILNMEIYRLGTRLFMIVETPDDFDWDAAFARLLIHRRSSDLPPEQIQRMYGYYKHPGEDVYFY